MCHLIFIRLLKTQQYNKTGEWVSKKIYEQIEGIRELQSGSAQSKHRKQKWL